MIRKIEIQNFKSIADLTLDLGRVNVFIGENGSGKSNILEAVAMGAAGYDEDDFDAAEIAKRGSRTTDSQSMFSKFMQDNEGAIDVNISGNDLNFSYNIKIYNRHNSFNSWSAIHPLREKFDKVRSTIKFKEVNAYISKIPLKIPYWDNNEFNSFENYSNKIEENGISVISKFSIYAPENYFLRKFEEDVSVLGSRGEGLFKLLTVTAQESPESILQIKTLLAQLLNWFDDFSFPEDLFSNERRLHIRDRYLKETLHAFDQRSANEGFLYLLFYFTLFVSKYTPKFFAIDNLDNALNPRLCAELMRTLCSLAAEHDKQCLITTHNPAVLDGLNLEDDEQRLFVVSRNLDGHTQIRRVMPTKQIPGVENDLRLSERFIRGFIGGLPTNF